MLTKKSFDFLPDELRDASQCRLVVTFYDQIVASLEEAIEAIEAGEIERRYNAVKVATGLISELHLALDEEFGGDIARNLGQIYTYVLTRLPRVNTHNDPAPAENGLRLLKPLRDSWAELDQMIEAGQVPGYTSAPAFNGHVRRADAAQMTA